MADILRVTSPVLSKNVVESNKPVADPSIPFDLQEISHIVKNPNSSGLLGQHNVLQKETGSAVLMNLLKDPDVTVNYLKNIYMLEEIINLLPVNNKTVTQEIQQLFQSLLIKPDQIVEELLKQEYASTLFKGPLFENLRGLLAENPCMSKEIADLLKSVNGTIARQDVMDSAANSLEYLSDQLAGSSRLSGRISDLLMQLRAPDSASHFQALKGEILELLKDLESSILYSPQIEKVVPIIIYNLSRFQDNESFFQESLLNVLIHINGRENKEELKQLIFDYIEGFRSGETVKNRSRIMDVLAEIIGKQDRESEMASLNGDKIEKIIVSLLSSPCNYTPLLHFVIPVEYQGLTAFSELWLDPNDSGSKNYKGEKDGESHVHVLITFDISGIGQFEAEFMADGKELSFYLFCPGDYARIFAGLIPEFTGIIQEKGYRLSELKVDKLDKNRSLMDVFKNLPYKRTGVDVKI